MIETKTYTGRVPQPWYKKINPIWWFGNNPEPNPPQWYNPNWLTVFRYLGWYVRNPLVNFSNYVVGVVDRNYSYSGPEPVDTPIWSDLNKTGWKWCIIHTMIPLPFVSYAGKRILFYAGWMSGGNLGFKLNFRNSPIQVI